MTNAKKKKKNKIKKKWRKCFIVLFSSWARVSFRFCFFLSSSTFMNILIY